MAFLMLFLSFLMSPTVMVTAVDKEADISMVFNLAEEETKETKEKGAGLSDEFFKKSNLLVGSLELKEIKGSETFYIKILANLYCPGEVAPPPELS